MEIDPAELKQLLSEELTPALNSWEKALEGFSKSFDVFLAGYEKLRGENQKLLAENKARAKADEERGSLLSAMKEIEGKMSGIRVTLSRLGVVAPTTNGGGGH